MIQYLYDCDDELIAWALHRNPVNRFRSDARAIGMASNGEIRFAAIYDDWSDVGCLFHFASDGKPNWFTREMAIRCFAYPFMQCGLRRMSALISLYNRPAVQFTMRFGGWKHEGTLRKAGLDGEDLLLFGLLREDCPDWISRRLPMTKPALAV